MLCEGGPGGREGLSAVRELSPAAILDLVSDDQMTSIQNTKSNKADDWPRQRSNTANAESPFVCAESVFTIMKHT